MSFTFEEKAYLDACLETLCPAPGVDLMKEAYVHGGQSVYDHSMDVAELSYWLGKRLGLSLEYESLVRGAFLHDYYLYDCHDGVKRGHMLHHNEVALRNACQDFVLTAKEQNIIESHMWPLTLRKLPKSREAVLVSLADKICAAREDFRHRLVAKLSRKRRLAAESAL